MGCVKEAGQESESIEIIDRPELKSRFRICAESTITAVFWAAYLYCVLPVIQATLMSVGIGFSEHLLFGGSARGLISWLQFTFELGLAVAISFALWSLYNYTRYHATSEWKGLPVTTVYRDALKSFLHLGGPRPRAHSFSRFGVPALIVTLFLSCGLAWTLPCGEAASDEVRTSGDEFVLLTKDSGDPLAPDSGARKDSGPRVGHTVVHKARNATPRQHRYAKSMIGKGRPPFLRIVKKEGTLSGLPPKKYRPYDHALFVTVMRKNSVARNANRTTARETTLFPPGEQRLRISPPKKETPLVAFAESPEHWAPPPKAESKDDDWERVKILRWYPSTIF